MTKNIVILAGGASTRMKKSSNKNLNARYITIYPFLALVHKTENGLHKHRIKN